MAAISKPNDVSTSPSSKKKAPLDIDMKVIVVFLFSYSHRLASLTIMGRQRVSQLKGSLTVDFLAVLNSVPRRAQI